MANIDLQGTKFSFTLLPLEEGEKEWATTEISVRNEYISYALKGKYISLTAIAELLTALSRLLAGGFAREYNLAFDKAGIAVDMYPYTENGEPVERVVRTQKDCVVAFRLLMRGKEAFLGGVYTLLLHRAEVETFTELLRQEYDKIRVHLIPAMGKYRFVGVSPRGYKGCNYLYLDEVGVREGEYAWVRMGRRQIEQVVYVDSVQWFDDEDVPYNPRTVKKVLRKATDEEIEAYLKEWTR